MGKATGNPRGRPKGSANKATINRVTAAAAAGILPHEFLLCIVRGERIAVDGGLYVVPDLEARIDAAKAVAPFYAPKLAQIEVSSEAKVVHEISSTPLSPEDRDRDWLQAHGAPQTH